MVSNYNSEKNLTAGTVQEFISHYQTEMQSNVIQMEDSLRWLQQHPEDHSRLQEIKKLGEAISDLAMVYGYEGVEVIGTRIVQVIDSFDSHSNLEQLIAHLDEAAKAVEEAMLLIDERRERQLIRSFSGETTTKPEAPPLPPATAGENGDEIVFDIREDEKLISLLSDTDGKAIEINQQSEHDDDNDTPQILDASLIFDKKHPQFDFDIPTSKPKKNALDAIEGIEEDILEIDFKDSTVKVSSKEKDGLLKKISHLLGLKNKTPLSAQG